MKRLILLAILAFTTACGGGGGEGTGGGSGSNGGGSGSNGGGSGATGGGSGGTTGWREIEPPADYYGGAYYVHGIHCTAADKCVVAANLASRRGGGLYALGANAWGELLVDGDYEDGTLDELSGTLGDIGFLGFVPSRTGVVARITTSGAVVVGSGDLTQKSSWTAVEMGSVAPGDDFGLNATVTLQSTSDSDWVFVNNDGYVYSATQAPGASTQWTRIWSPTAVPPYPLDFETQFTADKTLCDWDITPSAQPYPSQPFYASPDLGIMIHPAYGLNQSSWRQIKNNEATFGASKAGVCISTDKGRHFYFKELPESDAELSSPGPFGVTCLDNDTCFAFNGTSFQQNSYIYYSTNATQGKNSTWTRATLPAAFATNNQIGIAALFFAPDKVHGWAVGNNARKPMLLRTTDSGHTWTDVSGQVTQLAESDLINGFALDKDRIWVTGRYGFIGTTDTAQK
ncbi:MAG: hypothetical protein ACO1OB_05815 [Archangium sp.]